MKQAAFSVVLNCREAFNTVVPESMAAGCIPICYEGYGGQDNLKDGLNAYVFPNNYIYPLLTRLYDLIERYEQLAPELKQVRLRAYQSACPYSENNTVKALLDFYSPVIS